MGRRRIRFRTLARLPFQRHLQNIEVEDRQEVRLLARDGLPSEEGDILRLRLKPDGPDHRGAAVEVAEALEPDPLACTFWEAMQRTPFWPGPGPGPSPSTPVGSTQGSLFGKNWFSVGFSTGDHFYISKGLGGRY